MKHLFIAILATVALFSCTKKDSALEQKHEYSNYRVYFTSKSQHDTTYTPTKGARVETVGLDSAQDGKLKAVLMAYDGHGGYTIQVTNLQDCDGTIKWDWDGLTITNITPGGPESALAAHQTKTFYLTGTAKIGHIKVKFFGDCGPSSALVINITTVILPIVYLNYTVSYNDKLNKHVISFDVEQPQDVDWIIVEQLIGKEYKLVYRIPGDNVTKQYAIKL